MFSPACPRLFQATARFQGSGHKEGLTASGVPWHIHVSPFFAAVNRGKCKEKKSRAFSLTSLRTSLGRQGGAKPHQGGARPEGLKNGAAEKIQGRINSEVIQDNGGNFRAVRHQSAPSGNPREGRLESR